MGLLLFRKGVMFWKEARLRKGALVWETGGGFVKRCVFWKLVVVS